MCISSRRQQPCWRRRRGVNVINLLATQLGEMMTNVGDFDSRTTFGSTAAGGGGEFLVRVGSTI
ncbi:hypothetical protein X753_31620 [Mesorhizobium sp. LNJC399B00]|nr:hypothetical protein X753_31620 [Mesorhizobium sp. LNJC399B00]